MSETRVNEITKESIKTDMEKTIEDFSKNVNEIVTDIEELSTCWNGPKASSYINQLNNFLPNFTMIYNTFEKSKNDFDKFVQNYVDTDNNT